MVSDPGSDLKSLHHWSLCKYVMHQFSAEKETNHFNLLHTCSIFGWKLAKQQAAHPIHIPLHPPTVLSPSPSLGRVTMSWSVVNTAVASSGCVYSGSRNLNVSRSRSEENWRDPVTVTTTLVMPGQIWSIWASTGPRVWASATNRKHFGVSSTNTSASEGNGSSSTQLNAWGRCLDQLPLLVVVGGKDDCLDLRDHARIHWGVRENGKMILCFLDCEFSTDMWGRYTLYYIDTHDRVQQYNWLITEI